MVLSCYVAFGSVIMACSIFALARGERARRLEMSQYNQESIPSNEEAVGGFDWLANTSKRDETVTSD
jgi:hypothetical protein